MKLEVLSRVAGGDPTRAPLLFVHGSSHAAWCWEEHFLPWFAREGCSSWALSLRGHGGSEGAERLRWTAVAGYVDDVRQVVERLPARPILIGHSLGGLVVQKYLERHDARGVVLLVSSPARGMLRPGLRLFGQDPLLFVRIGLSCDPGLFYETPGRVRKLLFSPEVPEEAVVRCWQRLGGESFRAVLEMTFNWPRIDVIRKRGCPILVVGGGSDNVVPPAAIEATARAYGARCEIFPGMGHDLMLEKNWEQVARCVREWVGSMDETG